MKQPYVDGLRRTAVHGVLWEGSSYLFGRLLVFGTTVALARILSPKDFGAVGLALVFVAAADVLTNVGAAQALIYLPDEPRRNDAAFVMFLVAGALMCAFGHVAAPAIGTFFGGGREIAGLVRVAALSILVASFWQVPDALLRRGLLFRRRVGADIVRATARGAASIAFAIAGLGAWAIILGSVAGDLVYSAIAWKLIDYRPSLQTLRVRHADLRPLLRFAVPAAGAAFLSYVLFDIDYVIVGHTLGTTQLGYYLVAFRIPEMAIINAFIVFSAVAFPAFSRLHGDRARLARGYLSAVRLQSTFGVAAGVALFFGSRPFVEIAFGAKWHAAITPLAYLGLYAAFRSIGTSAADAYKASGRPDLAVKMAALRLAILVPALIVAARGGIDTVARTQAMCALVFAIGMQTVAVRLLRVRSLDVIRSLVPGAVISAPITASWFLSRHITSPALEIATLGAGAIAGLFVALGIDDGLRREMRNLINAAFGSHADDASDGSTLARRAMRALDTSGVLHCIHHDAHMVDAAPRGADIDVLVARRDLRRAHKALRSAGLHKLFAPGHATHRFYLGYDEGWLKVDIKCGLADGVPVGVVLARRVRANGLWVAPPEVEATHRQHRRTRGRGSPSTAARILRRCPGGPRRRGAIVALVGPDGAGKGTVASALEELIPIATTTVYLGWGGRAPTRAPTRDHPEDERARPPSAAREIAFLVYRASITWMRLLRVWSLSWRGHIVICDRWPSEVAAVKPERTRIGTIVERLLFVSLLPRPDAVLLLTAPAFMLYARKHEHTPEILARWTTGYAEAFGPHGAVEIATNGSRESTFRRAAVVVWNAFCERHGWDDALTDEIAEGVAIAS